MKYYALFYDSEFECFEYLYRFGNNILSIIVAEEQLPPILDWPEDIHSMFMKFSL